MLKVAVTLVFAVIVTTHVPAPLHAPLQLLKTDPPLGVAVNVTTAPYANVFAHVLPQLMPSGELLTVPLPAPLLPTVNTLERPSYAPMS